MLIRAVPVDLYKLLQDCCLTSVASLRVLGRIMIMAIDFAFVLVVAILRAKNRWANGAGEVFNVVFPIQCCDVRAAKSTSTFIAQEIQPAKIVDLAKWVLPIAFLVIYRKEF